MGGTFGAGALGGGVSGSGSLQAAPVMQSFGINEKDLGESRMRKRLTSALAQGMQLGFLFIRFALRHRRAPCLQGLPDSCPRKWAAVKPIPSWD